MANNLASVTLLKSAKEQDAHWVLKAQNGSIDAFESLFRIHQKRIYALCFRMCGNSRTAEDLTQESFITAWQKIKSFRGDSQFATWLHRVASNTVISFFRKEKRWQNDTDFDADFSQMESKKEWRLSRDLEKAIARLPDKARMIFVMFELYGHTHEDIGAMMSISPGTCKAQVHRSRKLLKEWFQDDNNE